MPPTWKVYKGFLNMKRTNFLKMIFACLGAGLVPFSPLFSGDKNDGMLIARYVTKEFDLGSQVGIALRIYKGSRSIWGDALRFTKGAGGATDTVNINICKDDLWAMVPSYLKPYIRFDIDNSWAEGILREANRKPMDLEAMGIIEYV